MYSQQHQGDRQASASNDNGRFWTSGRMARPAHGGIVAMASRTGRPVALDYLADGVYVISRRLAA